jgi:hypothetical protein
MPQLRPARDYRDAFRDRIACYRERAEQFRELAECEPDDRMRENLLNLAGRYDVIADGLGIKASRFF